MNRTQDMGKQSINKENQDKLYETMMEPILLYGLECWRKRKQDEKRTLFSINELIAEDSWEFKSSKIRNDKVAKRRR